MVQIATETDTIDDISCFLSVLHGCRGRLHAKNKSDSGKNQTGFSSFWPNSWEGKGYDSVSNSDDSVTFRKSIKNAVVTHEHWAESLKIQGKSGKTGSFRFCNKEIAGKACKPVFFMVRFPWIRIPILK